MCGDVEHLLERQDRLLPVEGGVRRPQRGKAFAGPQGLQFRQREVLGEPAGLGLAVDGLRGAAGRELGVARHIRGAADLVLVADDQDAVPAHDQIGLDDIGTLFDGPLIGRAGVFGPFARGPAMGDDQRMGQHRAPGQDKNRREDEPDHAPAVGAGDDAAMTVPRPRGSSLLPARPARSGPRQRPWAGRRRRTGFRPRPAGRNARR